MTKHILVCISIPPGFVAEFTIGNEYALDDLDQFYLGRFFTNLGTYRWVDMDNFKSKAEYRIGLINNILK